MIIDFKQIKNGALEKFDFSYTANLSEFLHLGENVFKNPVTIEGVLINQHGVIKIIAKAYTNLDTVCARCLKPISPYYEINIDNVLQTEKLDDDEDDTFVVLTDKLDLNEIIIPAILLDVPTRHLCCLECKGLCPKCGANLNTDKCKCDTRNIDPRLAVLQKLLDN